MSGRLLAGGLLGSGGTVYLSQTAAADHLRMLWQARSGWQSQWQHQPQQPSSPDKDVEDLRQMVQGLMRSMRTGQPTTVVLPGQQEGGYQSLLVLVTVTGAGVLYVRWFKGWKLGDLMYLTRASLQQSVSAVSSGVEALSSFVSTHIPFLQRRMDDLNDKQDEALKGQEELHEQMDDVGTSMRSLSDMLGNMEQAFLENQSYANEGIHMISRLLLDMARGGADRDLALHDLDQYVKRPVLAGYNVKGMESLLEDAPRPPGPLMSRPQLAAASDSSSDSTLPDEDHSSGEEYIAVEANAPEGAVGVSVRVKREPRHTAPELHTPPSQQTPSELQPPPEAAKQRPHRHTGPDLLQICEPSAEPAAKSQTHSKQPSRAGNSKQHQSQPSRISLERLLNGQ